MTTAAEYIELSDGAAVVEFPGASDEEANRRAVGLAAALAGAALPGLLDAIPGARTLALTFDRAQLPPETVRREALARLTEPGPPVSGNAVEIETLYGGDAGPDLPDLAAAAGVSAEEFATRHAAGEYTVAFLGFAPGFAYLSGLEPALRAARLPSPRPRVPAGSVAIGGPYTGVYPSTTPGGWRLIGRSAVRLFDEHNDPPALLRPGDRVRFSSIGVSRFAQLERGLADAASRISTFPGGRPVLRVIKPGVFTSVQGAPRFGRGGSGLPPGGAFDQTALARANRRIGNAPDAPALEMTLLGPELEALSEAGMHLAGADMAIERNGAAISSPFRVSPGDRLRFGPARGGARAYLAVEAGLLAPGRLHLTRRLESGEILMLRAGGFVPSSAPAAVASEPPPDFSGELVLRVALDPRRGRFFEPRAIERLLDTVFRVSSTSDRRGVRLEGDPVAASGDSEMPPEGTALGTIQVPAGGQPIVLGPDRPITGGYARIGIVLPGDWPLLAQAAPGRPVRFAAATAAETAGGRE